MHEAMFYEPYKDKTLKCTLCPHLCLIQDGKYGSCAVRKNLGGKLFSLVYGKTISYAVDPIEKKPLFHFYPGSRIFSYATAGCNFKCSFCQNWQISQISKGKEGKIIGERLSPKEIVEMAKETNCQSIAMTYNEPSIQFEYAFDVCIEAKKQGLKTVLVSNGYITKEPIKKISRYLDAINIDLKSFDDGFYKRICGARLKPVLDAIKYYHQNNIWLEITTLVIPGENDSDEELRDIAGFISDIDKDIPWHISRFHPDYEMLDKKETPLVTLERAYALGKEAGLNYVYLGNLIGNDHKNTNCPNCMNLLIKRQGYHILKNDIIKEGCNSCNYLIKGIF